MKLKRMKQLIEASNVLGFDFEDDDFNVCWFVTPGAGKMLARRRLEDNDGMVVEEYIAVPYDRIDAVDDLYNDIVSDFVEFYYDALRGGGATEWSLFEDIASPHDEGLLEMLSFFGKTYGEFLNDVFFWFGIVGEVEAMLNEEGESKYSTLDEDERLAKKVLDHLGKHRLCIAYDVSGGGFYWNFAKANGRLWYSSFEVDSFDFGYFIGEPIYGSVDLSDIDSVEALRDAVIGDFSKGSWELTEYGDALTLLNINSNDL